jgi:transmembrane channel-like protein
MYTNHTTKSPSSLFLHSASQTNTHTNTHTHTHSLTHSHPFCVSPSHFPLLSHSITTILCSSPSQVGLFVRFDLERKGRVTFDDIVDELDTVYGNMLNPVVIDRLKKVRRRYIQRPIHFHDFIATLVRIKSRFDARRRDTTLRSMSSNFAHQMSLFRKNTTDLKNQAQEKWQKMSRCERAQDDLRRWWAKKQKTWSFYEVFPLWKESFSFIEAKFGSSVLSYFVFQRSLFFLNLVTLGLFLFLIVPGMENYAWSNTSGSEWIGLAIGSGMENTWLFYGYYSPTYWNNSYKIDLAWILVVGCMYALAFFITLSYVDKGTKVSRHYPPFFNLAFGKLDQSLGDKRTIAVQQLEIKTSMILRLREKEEKSRAKLTIESQTSRRVFGIFLTFVYVIGTSVFVAWLILEKEEDLVTSLDQYRVGQYVSSLVVPAAVTFFKTLSPFVISRIVDMENWQRSSQRFRQQFTRNFFVRMFYLLAVMFQTVFNDNLKTTISDGTQLCNESQVGLIYYKLLFMDIAFEAVISLLVPYVTQRCSCFRSNRSQQLSFRQSRRDAILHDEEDVHETKHVFKIDIAIIDTMYRQALVWSGSVYCPFLPVLVVLSNIITTQVKIWHVVYFCAPPRRPMGVAKQNRYVRGVLIVSLLLSFIPFAFFLRRKASCGPHVGLRPVDVLYVKYVDLLPTWANLILAYMQNVVFVWLIILLVFIYSSVLTRKIITMKRDMNHLKQRVKMESREKRAILRSNNIRLGDDDRLGADMFKSWVDEIGAMGRLYCSYFVDTGYGDLFQLLDLEDEQLAELMTGFGAPQDHVEFFIDQLQEKRIELIK